MGHVKCMGEGLELRRGTKGRREPRTEKQRKAEKKGRHGVGVGTPSSLRQLLSKDSRHLFENQDPFEKNLLF